MGVKDKNKSLVEIAVELIHEKHKFVKGPFPIKDIAKETMEIKGLKTKEGRELLPQFFADFMESGYFVYCGDGKWDLKEYQKLEILEKEISDTYSLDDEEEVKKAELGYDQNPENPTSKNETESSAEDNEEEDDDKKENEEDYDFNLESYEGEQEEEKANPETATEEEKESSEEVNLSVEEIDEL